MRHLDTQVVVWLYAGLAHRLEPARRHIEGHPLLISPMVLLELQYLHEIRRISVAGPDIVDTLGATMGLRITCEPWSEVARAALALSWTRDPFDRLIVANALVAGVPLVTADETIRANATMAVWS